MSERGRPWRLVPSLVAAIVLLATGAGAQLSNKLGPYVLFAQSSIHVRTATIESGDVGVNAGLIYARGTILASNSVIGADVIHMDPPTYCRQLFTNVTVGGSASCRVSSFMPKPLLPDLATACNFPRPTFNNACDPNKFVFVDHDQVVDPSVYPPGRYGRLLIQGGGAGPGTLKLAPGDYSFCDVRVGRGAKILFSGPTNILVEGSARFSNAAIVGPDPSLPAATAPPAGAIKWFVGGPQVRYSRNAELKEHLCAPSAKLNIGGGASLEGRFAAFAIRLKRPVKLKRTPPVPGICGDGIISPDETCESVADCSAGLACDACHCVTPTTTTTISSTTTTTTTTLPGCDDDADCNNGSPNGALVCMDGHCIPRCDDDADCNNGSPGGALVCVDGHCVPRCDDDADCNNGSPGGGFVCMDDHCVPRCDDNMDCSSAGGGFICVDGHCVPGGSTTTTPTTSTTSSSSTTSTPTTTSTSSTSHPCQSDADCPIGRCVDGTCKTECTDDEDCNQGSPSGALVCVNGRCTGEVCDDCVDNDGDGLVDFEDPDCCGPTVGTRFDMQLRKGRFRQGATQQSLLRLRGTLAPNAMGNMIDPVHQQVQIQISAAGGGEVLCARIPAGKFTKVRKGYRYLRKSAPVPIELGRNLDAIRVKVLKNGSVRYRVRGKKTALTTPAEGVLTISVGFVREPQEQNVCSQAVRLFRGGKKGALRFP